MLKKNLTFAKVAKKIVNKKCYEQSCIRSGKIYISGTEIRKYIYNNKKIPEYLMDKRISSMLKNKSVLVAK